MWWDVHDQDSVGAAFEWDEIEDRTWRAQVRDCLGEHPRELPPEPLGLVWTREEEPHHLGVFFEVPIDNRFVADHLIDKAFKSRGRVHPLTMSFENPEELRVMAEGLDLEPWSRLVLEQGWLAKS